MIYMYKLLFISKIWKIKVEVNGSLQNILNMYVLFCILVLFSVIDVELGMLILFIILFNDDLF